jgi:malate dehydrogenase (oxaloacetate-decarboxylating)
MCIAAAEEIARCAEEKGLAEESILPRMDDRELFAREAAAVGMKAIEQGVAARMSSRDELFHQALRTIERAQDETKALMEKGLIPNLE